MSRALRSASWFLNYHRLVLTVKSLPPRTQLQSEHIIRQPVVNLQAVQNCQLTLLAVETYACSYSTVGCFAGLCSLVMRNVRALSMLDNAKGFSAT
ncbi:hypothetical protein T02_11495 [Trichinella nativa]|uniref:Uncharacterized protein n=1 Tax=Trichinella nativa TaxID=6335 RepID=A0A0V1KP25_9BILA|nr:hypothetical protein T02_11495 [Trichinella nativa]